MSKAWRTSSASCSTSPNSTRSSSTPTRRPICRSVAAEVAEFVAPLALAQGKDVALLGDDRAGLGQGQCRRCWAGLSAISPKTPSTTRRRDTTVEFVVDENGTVERARPRTRHRRRRTQSDLPAFLAARPQEAGSTGLGLSIVQRIAELHSATITLENRRPAGARFSLKFVPVDLGVYGRTDRNAVGAQRPFAEPLAFAELPLGQFGGRALIGGMRPPACAGRFRSDARCRRARPS